MRGDAPSPPTPATGAMTPGATIGAVTTMLTPDERLRVDAAGMGLYRTMHRETLDDVIRDVRERGAAAVVMSVACCGSEELPRLARMVREFPRVPAVALLTEAASPAPHTMLGLGRSGVRALMSVWAKLLWPRR